MTTTIRAFCVGLILFAATDAMAQKSKTGSILPGGNSKKPINIEAGKLDYFDKEQKLVYTGNVIAIQGDSKLKSSVLTIYLAPKTANDTGAPTNNSVQRMLATGPVTMLQRDQVGTGDSGVYDKAQNTVVLTGNVTLSQGPNVTKGERLVYDLKSGEARVTGGPNRGVSSMFLPSSNEGGGTEGGKDDSKPAGARKSGSRQKADP